MPSSRFLGCKSLYKVRKQYIEFRRALASFADKIEAFVRVGSLAWNREISMVTPIRQVVLVVTNSHLLQNLSSAENLNDCVTQAYYFAKTSDSKKLLVESTRYQIIISELTYRKLRVELRRSASERSQFTLLLPLLAEYLFDQKTYELVCALFKFGFVSFYDDGLAGACSKTQNMIRGLVPSREKIFSWDYSFIAFSKGYPQTVTRSSLSASRKLLRSSLKDEYLVFSNYFENIQCCSDNKVINANIILSSKGLSLPLVLECIGKSALRQTVYVPHYQKWKNNNFLINACVVLNPQNLESALLGLVENQSCRILFGISSSVLYVLEACLSTLRSNKGLHYEMILCCNTAELDKDSSHEYEDFSKVIMSYNRDRLCTIIQQHE